MWCIHFKGFMICSIKPIWGYKDEETSCPSELSLPLPCKKNHPWILTSFSHLYTATQLLYFPYKGKAWKKNKKLLLFSSLAAYIVVCGLQGSGGYGPLQPDPASPEIMPTQAGRWGTGTICRSSRGISSPCPVLLERQVLEIRGPADHAEMRPRTLPSSLLRQRASPVSHLRVSDCRPCCSKYKCQRMFSCGSKSHCLGVCLADRSSSSPFPSCSIMRAGMVDGKRGQKRRSSPGARVVFPYADLTHPHVASLCAVLSELNLGRGRERFALTVFLK